MLPPLAFTASDARFGAVHSPLSTSPSELHSPTPIAHPDTKELGLACGYLLGRHFLGWEDLHYGLWKPGITVDVAHMREAQREYSHFIESRIPEQVKSILDVGCGSGTLAERLIQHGFIVDCVLPSPFSNANCAAQAWRSGRTFRMPIRVSADEQAIRRPAFLRELSVHKNS